MRIALFIALVVVACTGVIYLYQWDPGTTNVLGRCQFLERTGYLCPGCGGTRAMNALLHLQPLRALALNPLVYVALGLLLVLANVIGRELLGPRYPVPILNIPTWVAWSLLTLVLMFWVVRNIPVWPFTLLTP